MISDGEALRELNMEIGQKEKEGDAGFFERLLAPAFAMRRASGVILDREEFLASIGESDERLTEIESVTLHGETRASVVCTVTTGAGPMLKPFRNLRLFVRSSNSGPWQLLAWANEPGS